MGKQKKRNFSKSAKFLRDWNDFAAKTKFGSVVEYFCAHKVGLGKFSSGEKKEENLDLGNFCPKKRKRERELDLKYFVQVKGRRRVK